MRRCLDTTFLSRLVRGDQRASSLLRAYEAASDEAVTTEVNFFEVALGVDLTEAPAARARYTRAWEGILRTIEVVPLTRRATLLAVRRQAEMYRAGKAAPVPDLLVSAIGKVGGCQEVVTRDTDDFARIGLLRAVSH
jgi:predicted nucleic acid-binding protein